MPWLSQSSRDGLHQNLTTLESLYQSVKPGMVSAMGSGFSYKPDDHLRFAFCNLVAFDLKPYVASLATRLRDLMLEDGLDCDNYARLAWIFFEIMRPTHNSEVCVVGWEGGLIGNHAQMQIRTAGHPDLYADPTVGLIVHGTSFDYLCKAPTIPTNLQYSIYSFNQRAEVSALEANVRNQITNGGYLASHLLYVYSDLKKYDSSVRSALGTYPVRNG